MGTTKEEGRGADAGSGAEKRSERRRALLSAARPGLSEECRAIAMETARILDSLRTEEEAMAALAAAFESRVAEAYAQGWSDRAAGVGFDAATGRTEADGWRKVAAAKAGSDAAASLLSACVLAGRTSVETARSVLRSAFPKLGGPAALRLLLEPGKAACAGPFLFHPKDWDAKA